MIDDINLEEKELSPRKRGRKKTQRTPKKFLCSCGLMFSDPIEYRDHKRGQEDPGAHIFTLVDEP